MRIRKITIRHWRNFRDIVIEVPEDAPLICLVGANGTGKSHVLELISASAHRVGLSPGVALPRGDPFSDTEKDFSIEFFLSEGVSSALDSAVSGSELHKGWDRTITVDGSGPMTAGGIEDGGASVDAAKRVVDALRISKEVHHLSLDADRSFPKRDIPTNELAQVFDQPWFDEAFNKKRAHQTTRQLYEEWMKYCLAKENQAANLHYQQARRAKEGTDTPPTFRDTFGSYRDSLRQVMPHLLFSGADQRKKSILFDTAGMQLRFDQLSGGEREIAFLVGQIDRFGLRNGLFLLDEPELHLNPDLVRAWVTYLAGTVATGQTWLATHSLEAVEAAGLGSTILLERDQNSKFVTTAVSLAEKPVLSALSRAVGTPAFSIDGFRFVYVEGEEAIGERERFRKLTGLATDTRFIECRSCGEVIQRVDGLRSIAAEVEERIRVVGVIDRDWRTTPEVTQLEQDHDIIALPVHEVENFFLHPASFEALASDIGQHAFVYEDELRTACDARAGGWILQNALSSEKYSDISHIASVARTVAYDTKWSEIRKDVDAAMSKVSGLADLEERLTRRLKARLTVSAKTYERRRASSDLWKVCEGKEVSKFLARRVGLSGLPALERALLEKWESGRVPWPPEIVSLRRRLKKK